ncbi:MAG: hypothetical protein K9J50_06860 [Sulfuritalea sp.]|nr:hypothetical protein [Sulfuritalea sp.]
MVKIRFMKVGAMVSKKFTVNAMSIKGKGHTRYAFYALIMALGLASCTPALNWRAVSVAGVATWLPCKPDRAQRQLDIGGQTIQMEMAGCEAQGVMYALSHARVPKASESEAVAAAWQSASLKQMQAGMPQHTVFHTRGENQIQGRFFKATGARSNGEVLKAQLVWVIKGDEIFHLAMYAATMTAEQADPFFSEVKIQ